MTGRSHTVGRLHRSTQRGDQGKGDLPEAPSPPGGQRRAPSHAHSPRGGGSPSPRPRPPRPRAGGPGAPEPPPPSRGRSRAEPYLRRHRKAALARGCFHAAVTPRRSCPCQGHAGHSRCHRAATRHGSSAGRESPPQPSAPGRQPGASPRRRRHLCGSA